MCGRAVKGSFPPPTPESGRPPRWCPGQDPVLRRPGRADFSLIEHEHTLLQYPLARLRSCNMTRTESPTVSDRESIRSSTRIFWLISSVAGGLVVMRSRLGRLHETHWARYARCSFPLRQRVYLSVRICASRSNSRIFAMILRSCCFRGRELPIVGDTFPANRIPPR
jgi:hypothetical protein